MGRGYVQAEMAVPESVVIGGLVAALLAILVDAYVESVHLDREAS